MIGYDHIVVSLYPSSWSLRAKHVGGHVVVETVPHASGVDNLVLIDAKMHLQKSLNLW